MREGRRRAWGSQGVERVARRARRAAAAAARLGLVIALGTWAISLSDSAVQRFCEEHPAQCRWAAVCECCYGECSCPRVPIPMDWRLLVLSAAVRAAAFLLPAVAAILAAAYLRYGCIRCIDERLARHLSDARHITHVRAEEHG